MVYDNPHITGYIYISNVYTLNNLVPFLYCSNKAVKDFRIAQVAVLHRKCRVLEELKCSSVVAKLEDDDVDLDSRESYC